MNTPSPPKEQSFGESAIDKKQQREHGEAEVFDND